MLKANVLPSLGKQDENVIVDGYINNIVVFNACIGVAVDPDIEVTWLVGIGIDEVEDVA